MFDKDKFLARYPEFNSVDPVAIQAIGEDSDLFLSDSSWGKFRDIGLYLYTAHKIAIRYKVGKGYSEAGVNNPSSGIITSKSASGASLSDSVELNAMVTSGNPIYADLGRTQYGLEYLSLLKQIMSSGVIVDSGGIQNVF